MSTRRTSSSMVLSTVALCLLWLTCWSTALAGEPMAFSHVLHVQTEELPCGSCHVPQEQGTPVLGEGVCAECHDDDRQSRAFTFIRGTRPALDFPHGTHDAALECLQCHKATASETQEASEALVPFEACTACHVEQGVGAGARACRACHGEPRTQRAPAEHQRNWISTHGELAGFAANAEHGAEDCALCHAESSCSSCHATRAPADHDGLWRVRAHGIEAGWDRDRCTTCHETGTCESCHRVSEPMNHSGAWRATHALVALTEDNETCTTCHAPSWCVACHNDQL